MLPESSTSTGPCGIAIVAGGSLVTVAIFLLIIGAIVLFRGLRRPVEESGGVDGASRRRSS